MIRSACFSCLRDRRWLRASSISGSNQNFASPFPPRTWTCTRGSSREKKKPKAALTEYGGTHGSSPGVDCMQCRQPRVGCLAARRCPAVAWFNPNRAGLHRQGERLAWRGEGPPQAGVGRTARHPALAAPAPHGSDWTGAAQMGWRRPTVGSRARPRPSRCTRSGADRLFVVATIAHSVRVAVEDAAVEDACRGGRCLAPEGGISGLLRIAGWERRLPAGSWAQPMHGRLASQGGLGPPAGKMPALPASAPSSGHPLTGAGTSRSAFRGLGPSVHRPRRIRRRWYPERYILRLSWPLQPWVDHFRPELARGGSSRRAHVPGTL